MSDWELLTDTASNRLERIRVPGGWLYRTILFGSTPIGSGALAVALAFVPLTAEKPRGGPR
jgi:hypothetical protein